MLYYEAIDSPTLALLRSLMEAPEFRQLNLAGGTSLALQIGHRKSIDIDLFGTFEMDDYQFSTTLKQFESVIQLYNSKNIKSYVINQVKVDFVNYPYPWIEPVLWVDQIRLADKRDIAAMKLAAIAGRGTKKDFIDIFSLLAFYSLEQMLEFYLRKFSDGSAFMVIKSLTYFKDAEKDESPFLLHDIHWETVKSTLVSETRKYIDSR